MGCGASSVGTSPVGTGPHPFDGPTPGLKLCCPGLKILDNFLTKSLTFLSCTGPCKLRSQMVFRGPFTLTLSREYSSPTSNFHVRRSLKSPKTRSQQTLGEAVNSVPTASYGDKSDTDTCSPQPPLQAIPNPRGSSYSPKRSLLSVSRCFLLPAMERSLCERRDWKGCTFPSGEVPRTCMDNSC